MKGGGGIWIRSNTILKGFEFKHISLMPFWILPLVLCIHQCNSILKTEMNLCCIKFPVSKGSEDTSLKEGLVIYCYRAIITVIYCYRAIIPLKLSQQFFTFEIPLSFTLENHKTLIRDSLSKKRVILPCNTSFLIIPVMVNIHPQST